MAPAPFLLVSIISERSKRMDGKGVASLEREAKRRNLGKGEEDLGKEEEDDDFDEEVAEEEEDDDDVDSSSPLCQPSAYLPTQEHMKRSCLFDDPLLLPVRESGTKVVLCGAKFVVGLSSYVGGNLLARCSGFWIDWDEENKTGIVLTTAHLILAMNWDLNIWLCKHEYAPHAKVVVHLLDDTTTEGHLLYYHNHYSIALFRARVDQPVRLPSFSDMVKCSQEVFRLGRDQDFNLKITHGRVEYKNLVIYQRYHYMYVFLESGQYEDVEDGGPVIDFDGKVVGMVNDTANGSFIPYSILLKSLDLWRKFGCIPPLHLGLKFSAIKLLDPVHIEKIRRKLNIDNGLIVDEVSKGSHAERLGIRDGDVIECFNGECISTMTEITVFHTHQRLRRTRILTVKISDQGEIIETDETT